MIMFSGINAALLRQGRARCPCKRCGNKEMFDTDIITSWTKPQFRTYTWSVIRFTTLTIGLVSKTRSRRGPSISRANSSISLEISSNEE